MKSIRRIALCVAFVASSGTLGFFTWQDYQLRQDEFYRLGALYKARFPKVGKYVVDDLKKGDDESLMALGFMLIPDDTTAQEKAFIESAGELLMDSDIHVERKKAAAFVAGFESTSIPEPLDSAQSRRFRFRFVCNPLQIKRCARQHESDSLSL